MKLFIQTEKGFILTCKSRGRKGRTVAFRWKNHAFKKRKKYKMKVHFYKVTYKFHFNKLCCLLNTLGNTFSGT